jgi:hypothetical protein
VAQLASVDERMLNELFFVVSDIEAIMMLLQRCEDPLTQKVYNKILHLLSKCLSKKRTEPSLASITGPPPFETPTIATAVANFVREKYSYLPMPQNQIINSVARMFLFFVNRWRLESPLKYLHRNDAIDAAMYNSMYERWMCWCLVPTSCVTIQSRDATQVFGQMFLKAIYPLLSEQIVIQLQSVRFTSPDKQPIMLVTFPKYVVFQLTPLKNYAIGYCVDINRFLEEFRQEVFREHSEVWESDDQDTAIYLKGLLRTEEGSALDTSSLEDLQPESTMESSSLLDDVSSDEKPGGQESGNREVLDVLEDNLDLLNLSLTSTDSFGSLPDLDIDELLANDSVFQDDIAFGGLREQPRHGKDMGYFDKLESTDEEPKNDSSLTRGSPSLSDPSVAASLSLAELAARSPELPSPDLLDVPPLTEGDTAIGKNSS